MKRLLASFGFAVALSAVWLGTVSSACGQVDVEPGLIVAPFVRIEFNHGQVHVQAPFVDLYTHGPICHDFEAYPNCPPVGAPMIPSSTPMNPATPLATPPAPVVSEVQARQNLLMAARSLDRSLGQYATAASWRHYLAVGAGEALSTDTLRLAGYSNSASIGGSATQPSVETLSTILAHFDATSKNSDDRLISSLPAFRQTRAQLAAYMTSLARNVDDRPPVPGDGTAVLVPPRQPYSTGRSEFSKPMRLTPPVKQPVDSKPAEEIPTPEDLPIP